MIYSCRVCPWTSFLFFPHHWISFNALVGPNSCLLFSMCDGYAYFGLFDFTYLQCSVKRVLRSLEVCPTYLRPHVWHRISYDATLSQII